MEQLVSTQQQDQSSFKITLVDIQHAAKEQRIVCVEKPLFPETDLKYVALSYRWGQAQNPPIDTGLGYVAIITAFRLDDFYALCKLILNEPDLRHMNYVWVDAICVDHANLEKRKATLHHMTSIYAHANYILAVPDLHQRALTDAHHHHRQHYHHRQVATLEYSQTIYHLLHGNTDALLQEAAAAADNDAKAVSLSRSMDILIDLVTEWSGRVLVIGECHIAKRKNKMKLWFSMLSLADWMDKSVAFFPFDFNGPASPTLALKTDALASALLQCYKDKYAAFYKTMAYQLKSQTFLEMMLKSNTRKNEDRFYAILPISEYKTKLTSQDVVDSWHITDMVSVKLKLYEIMNVKDKLLLLFMAGNPSSISQVMTLPTFATTTLHFPTLSHTMSPLLLNHTKDDEANCNFDLTDLSAIMLVLPSATITATTITSTVVEQPSLHIKPKEYYKKDDGDWQKKAGAASPLDLSDACVTMVCIPFVCHSVMKRVDDDNNDDGNSYAYWYPRQIYLIGSFDKNKWTLTKMAEPQNVAIQPDWTLHRDENYSTGFNIY